MKLKKFTVIGMYCENQQLWIESFSLPENESTEDILTLAFDTVVKNNRLDPGPKATWENNNEIHFMLIFEGDLKSHWVNPEN